MNVQTFGSTLRAEISRLLGRGGARTWFIVTIVYGTACVVGIVALASIQEIQDVSAFAVADVATVGPLFGLIVLCLAATSHKAREISDGTVLTSKALVPRSLLLYIARLCAWAVVTFAIGIVTTVAGLLIGLAAPWIGGSSPTQVFASVATALFLNVLIVLFFAVTAAWLQRGAMIVFVGLLLVLILPVGLAIAAFFMSESVATVLMNIAQVLPGALMINSLQPPGEGLDATWPDWGRAVGGVVAWIVALGFLAYTQFRKPGYGDK